MKWMGLLVVVVMLSGWAHALEVPLDAKQSFLKFTGHATLHSFNGEAKQFNGSAQVDSPKPQTILGAKINIQAAQMTTFEDARDHKMMKWLHVDANPTMTFQLTRVLPMKGDPANATKDHPCLFTVVGDFTLNKKTKPLEAQVLGWREGKWLVVTGTTEINTTDYGLPIITQLFMTVDKEVDVTFRLVFDLPG